MTTSLPLTTVAVRACLVSPEAPASIPLVPGQLHVGFRVDDGLEVRDVSEADLEAWGTTLEELLPIAQARLSQESDVVEWIPVDTVPGMSLYLSLDGQSSARMLILGELIGELPMGGVLVTVPSEDQLIAVPLHEVEDLDALNVTVTATRLAWEGAERKLSDQAFWFDGTDWHHVEVVHDNGDATVILPPPARLAVGRLAAMGFVGRAAEA